MYKRQVPEMLRVTEDAKTGASEIARKQGRVEDLTRKLATLSLIHISEPTRPY